MEGHCFPQLRTWLLHSLQKNGLSYCIFLLFLVKISKNSSITIRLLDKQNYLRYLVLFPGEKTKLSAFCLKQVKLSASGVSKMLVLRIFDLLYTTGQQFYFFK